MIFREAANLWRRFLSVLGYLAMIIFIAGQVLKIVNEPGYYQITGMVLIALISSLSSLVFISKKELYGRDWWIREIICLLISETAALVIARYVGFYSGPLGAVVIFILTLIVAFGNHLIEYGIDIRTANQINDALKRK